MYLHDLRQPRQGGPTGAHAHRCTSEDKSEVRKQGHGTTGHSVETTVLLNRKALLKFASGEICPDSGALNCEGCFQVKRSCDSGIQDPPFERLLCALTVRSGVWEVNTPSERKTRRETSFQSTRSEGGEQCLLLDCRAKARTTHSSRRHWFGTFRGLIPSVLMRQRSYT